MTEAPPEQTPDSGYRPADKINDAIAHFTGDIGTALEDICSYGWTIGDSYVPFDPDEDSECDDDEALCSQMWVRVVQISAETADEAWDASCALELRIELEVGVLRCITVPEDGEAPTETDVLAAAMVAMDDMNTIQCAGMNSEAFDDLTLGTWVPVGPQGGQYGGVWSFTAVV